MPMGRSREISRLPSSRAKLIRAKLTYHAPGGSITMPWLPTVAAIIPCFNAAIRWRRDQIRVAQTYPGLEIVGVDDGSMRCDSAPWFEQIRTS
jgi:hypothetical protein